MQRAGSIGYRVIGGDNRPWLVVCHGMALDHREFLGMAAALADRWRVLLWDMPGHGASQPRPVDYGIPAMTDALEAVMAAATIDRAVILGFSFGGIVAQAFARRHPERLDALILHGCFMAYLQPALVPRALVGPLVAARYGLKSWDRIKADFIASCASTAAGRAAIAEAPDRLGRAGFFAMTRALLRANTPDPGFHITVPLLMIRGEADGYASAIDAGFAALAAVSPQAERVVVPAAGHCAHVDAPAAFQAAVEGFLTRVASASRSTDD